MAILGYMTFVLENKKTSWDFGSNKDYCYSSRAIGIKHYCNLIGVNRCVVVGSVVSFWLLFKLLEVVGIGSHDENGV